METILKTVSRPRPSFPNTEPYSSADPFSKAGVLHEQERVLERQGSQKTISQIKDPRRPCGDRNFITDEDDVTVHQIRFCEWMTAIAVIH